MITDFEVCAQYSLQAGNAVSLRLVKEDFVYGQLFHFSNMDEMKRGNDENHLCI